MVHSPNFCTYLLYYPIRAPLVLISDEKAPDFFCPLHLYIFKSENYEGIILIVYIVYGPGNLLKFDFLMPLWN